MANALVIVESPAKAKTIKGYLGPGFVVESSIGHIRDLPNGAQDVPKSYRSEPWARLGIDVDNDFKPLYVINSDKKDQIRRLRALLADAEELYLATDEDREGEAIAWHLLEVLNPRVPVKRMVFNEITRAAIQDAVRSPRELDRRLVDAQEARRMLDRLYGYEVSPVLWKKVLPRLSAGRVQSVATRLVVERERERMEFVSAAWWSLTGEFTPSDEATPQYSTFEATLARLDNKRVATGKDFASDGTLTQPSSGKEQVVLLDQPQAEALVGELAGEPFEVRSRQSKPYRRRPAAPFITSTFQQEAARKLGMSAAAAMRAAQTLYEQGFITYMRTDSTTLSAGALSAARAAVTERFGEGLVPSMPRLYRSKVANAQEAHEAIRPAGDVFRSPDAVAREVAPSQARVYELIWKRTLASQMIDCVGETVQLRVGAVSAKGRDVEFSASGTVISELGFRRVYTEGRDAASGDNASRDAASGNGASGNGASGNGAGREAARGEGAGGDGADRERRLPALEAGDGVDCRSLTPEGHETKPPARYTEASLVKRLEELGVGRPSTYASIMGTIVDRGYVWKKGTALVPSFTAFSVVVLLERHFPKMVDYAFTAEMEDDLDKIAGGKAQAVPWLSRFYFGDGDDPGLKAKVSSRLDEIDARGVNTIPLGVDDQGVPVAVRVGRYGPYVERGEDRASVPELLAPDELTVERALELLSSPRDGRVLGADPESGLDVVAREGRFGPYVQLRPADGDSSAKSAEKPKSASLLKGMSLQTITLEDALKLLSLPRVVGVDPGDGAEVTAHSGRYGPYVKKGDEIRNIASEDQLFTITLAECLELLAAPRQYRRAAPKPPLRELGEDPDTGLAMLVKDGRYGPYVTDGTTNASLRGGDTPESITPQRASELLADRRAKGPAKKRPARKAPAKSSKAKAAGTKSTKAKAAGTKSTKPNAAGSRSTKAKSAGTTGSGAKGSGSGSSSRAAKSTRPKSSSDE